MTLRLHEVRLSYAGVTAVAGVTMEVPRAAVTAVIGPNGAGKTSIVNLACGAVPPTSGQVTVDGTDLTGEGPRRFARAGVTRTFQGLRLFDSMTVRDNLLVGAHGAARLPLLGAVLRTPGFRRRERDLRARALRALEVVGLAELIGRPVHALSQGQRRRVELARALAADPAYLILDEPGAGLDPDAVAALAGTIRALADDGIGVLLVEHDAGLVERVADTCIGLVAGTVVATGAFDQVRRQGDIAAQLSAG